MRHTPGLEIPLTIESVAFGGKGVSRLADGKVCFVPGVIPGEKVTVKLGKVRKSFAEAELVKILESSPDRVKPPCTVFGRCGGCQYEHINYAKQLEIKRQQVFDVLQRLGGVKSPPVEETIGSPHEYAYRNRITVHVRNRKLGFFSEASGRIVEVSHCPIASDQVNSLLTELKALRPQDGEYPLREPGEYRGFRQVNDSVAGALLEVAEEMAQPGGCLLIDAFCGAGFFAKQLRGLFKLVVGIEWSADAVRMARQGVSDDEIYLLGDVKTHLPPAFMAAASTGTTLLLDPPSEGVDPEITEAILERLPQRIIYVSCNPPTLARDLKRLSGSYELKRARPIDMFPQTAEIEVVALLELIS
ncbi:hypothetical protein BH09VER1_BH09VER1_38810 [soil metagenome]